MKRVHLTAKRQATFPASLCDELGVGPGDDVLVERRIVGKQLVWVLRGRKPDWSWVGAARKYAEGKSHRWTDVEQAIAEGWARGDRS